MYYLFVADLALLTWVGAAEIMDATITLGQVCTAFLFFYLILVYPFLSVVESFLYLYGTRLLYSLSIISDSISNNISSDNSNVRASAAPRGHA